ncbi:MAG TPA: hypothetical protein VMD77_06715 [Candidatus Baltobacteraceae bacterium]|nr:hypothetical protein [Candidatus Baltobacteraceae bacterium]
MNFRILQNRAAMLAASLVLLSLALPARTSAQFGPPPPAAKPENPRLTAPQDFTGYWVAIVTEDWRYRMITPDKGDYGGVPLTQEGHALAETWDPAKDQADGNACRSYGAAAIMRVPTRLHITWQDDDTLRIDTDAGMQTRLLHFNATAPENAKPEWQGYSVASWEGLRNGGMFRIPTTLLGPNGAPRPESEGYLKVITTHMRPGYLRKNGAPYSANAVLEEYFDGFKEANGDTWLVVTAIVTDPHNLSQPFITSDQFKKQADATGWNPTPCEAK